MSNEREGTPRFWSYQIEWNRDGSWEERRNGIVTRWGPRWWQKLWFRLRPWRRWLAECDVFWGSHGCHRRKGHPGRHICSRGCTKVPHNVVLEPWEDDLGSWAVYDSEAGDWKRSPS